MTQACTLLSMRRRVEHLQDLLDHELAEHDAFHELLEVEAQLEQHRHGKQAEHRPGRAQRVCGARLGEERRQAGACMAQQGCQRTTPGWRLHGRGCSKWRAAITRSNIAMPPQLRSPTEHTM